MTQNSVPKEKVNAVEIVPPRMQLAKPKKAEKTQNVENWKKKKHYLQHLNKNGEK